jgi:hypothetical protein
MKTSLTTFDLIERIGKAPILPRDGLTHIGTLTVQERALLLHVLKEASITAIDYRGRIYRDL